MFERKVKNLGEIALRVNDLEKMQAFYPDVVGLELMKRFPTIAFFKIAEGYGGHTQILTLFDRSDRDEGEPDFGRSTIDHFAFGIDLVDYDSEKARLEGLGVEVTTAQHAWVQWRSLYFSDPEGNLVEFVCYDEAVT